MKFSLASLALLATSAIAAPTLLATNAAAASDSRLERRLQPATSGLRQSDSLSYPEPLSHKSANHDAGSPSATKVSYSTNWAGIVIESAPAGNFTAVSGTFTVPKPTYVNNGGPATQTQSAAIWVGIDGSSEKNSILQTGIKIFVTSSGAISYGAWYEWYPADATFFSNDIPFSPGDSVFLQVVATTPNSGTAIVENLTTGQKLSQQLSSTYTLAGQNAEWIVEDWTYQHSLVPLADWNSVTFTNAQAQTSTGQTVSAYSGNMKQINIKQNTTVYSSIGGSGTTVFINYANTTS